MHRRRDIDHELQRVMACGSSGVNASQGQCWDEAERRDSSQSSQSSGSRAAACQAVHRVRDACREAVAALEEMVGDPAAMVAVDNALLSEMAGELLRLRALAEGAAASVATEAAQRGVVAESGHRDVGSWVRGAAGAAGVAIAPAVGGHFQKLTELARRRGPGSAGLVRLTEAVMTGRLPVAAAVSLSKELTVIAAKVPAEVAATATDAMVDAACTGISAREIAAIREAILGRWACEALEADQELAHRHREFSAWTKDAWGRWVATIAVGDDAHAIIEAAINALAAPHLPRRCPTCSHSPEAGPATGTPGPVPTNPPTAAGEAGGSADGSVASLVRCAACADGHAACAGGQAAWVEGRSTSAPGCRAAAEGLAEERVPGVADLRTAGQRRADALTELCRLVATDPALVRGDHVRPGAAAKAQVIITIPLKDLRSGQGYGRDGFDTVVTASQARRLSCDAEIIPAVLGSDGAVLDLGRAARLASPDQIRALRLRDGGCTFPGCGRPASWCDSHHLQHWVDGGPTDLDNLTLLCGHHHTVVHARGWTGRLVGGRVSWSNKATADRSRPAPPATTRT